MAENKLKKLFEKKSNKFLASEDLSSLGNKVESSEYVKQFSDESERFIPPVDFDDPKNFVKFGSAKEYYNDAIVRVHDTYPYDGSGAEKLEFHNSSSYLDKWIYDTRYPTSTGYVNFNAAPNNTWTAKYNPATKEYISFQGGPHKDPESTSDYDSLVKTFAAANAYNTSKTRGSNLRWDWQNQGSTVEMWLKLGELNRSNSDSQVLFDLTNNISVSSSLSTPSGSPYGRLFIYFYEASDGASHPTTGFYANWYSGSVAKSQRIYGVTEGLAYASTGSWKHYAFSFKNDGTGLRYKVYENGNIVNNAVVTNGAINEVTGGLEATIGALSEGYKSVSSPDGGTTGSIGWFKLSGSVDEFRYWKKERTAEEIGKHWFTNVEGGTNTDSANVNLGVYYKFNEGIVGPSSTDATVLDYSGRVTNGTFVGYNTTYTRNTGSAIVSASAAPFEIEDPIIYSSHPKVKSLKTQLETSGSSYDRFNNTSMYYSIPSWISEQDDSSLLKLTQIMSSYLDTMYLQIEHLPKIKDNFYASGSSFKPATFAGELLDSAGFVSPEIFVDANVLEQFGSRTEDLLFEDKLHNIKNQIYQNIYNNLVYIYKSKGTEKSFRNLIRCYGIDDELVKLNIYADRSTYLFEDSFRSISEKKKVANFNTTDNFDAVIYQNSSSINANSVSFIQNSYKTQFIPRTVEANILFPKKLEPNQKGYFSTGFVTASLFGLHENHSNANTVSWKEASYDRSNMQVFAIRKKTEGKGVFFRLTSSLGPTSLPQLDSPFFEDVYDNQNWNISVRVIPTRHPVANFVDGSSNTTYDVIFSGFNSVLDVVHNHFTVSGTMDAGPGRNFASLPQRLYAGAHRTNFTGTVLQQTDVRISSIRYWMDHLSDNELKMHARDPFNYGRENPHRDAYPLITEPLRIRIPQKDTLALHWDFQQVTASNASGQFRVDDYSSGSTNFKNQKYGFLGETTEVQHMGVGFGFKANSATVVDVDYFVTGRQNIPENLQNSSMVQVLSDDDITFTRESRPVRHFFAFEKSMYDAVSQEMLQMFSTIKDFSYLIGNPVNRYRIEYKDLTKLRKLFFERVHNTPELDKYVEFYKWIDSSLGHMLNQLVPASADFADNVRNVVESHVLERSKYQSKFPTLKRLQNETSQFLPQRFAPQWQFSHFPPGRAPSDENRNHHWWRDRAERNAAGSDNVLASNNSGVDEDREALRQVRLSALQREQNSPMRISAELQIARHSPPRQIHGGTNFGPNKNLDFVISTTTFRSSDTALEIAATSLLSSSILDVEVPNEKTKIGYTATTHERKHSSGIDGDYATPFNLVEDPDGVVTGDFNSELRSNFATRVLLTNLHAEDEEIPMQGPFTNAHVGGRFHRHADLAKTPGPGPQLRPEAWDIEIASNKIKFRDPVQHAAGFYSRSKVYRDERAKRPLNIKNIKYDTGSFNLGNYQRNYEIVQLSGRTHNNLFFNDNGGTTRKHPENFYLSKSFSNAVGMSTMFELPTRRMSDGKNNKSVIVNRFNAPGGKDVSSRGVLDAFAEEYATHNALPFRNRTVRLKHRADLVKHSGQFGFYPHNTYAVRLDGDYSYFGIPAVENPVRRLHLRGQDFGLSMWFRYTKKSGMADEYLFLINNGSNIRFGVALNRDAFIEVQDGSTTRTSTGHDRLNDGEWHHLFLQVEFSSGGNETVTIFIDGVDRSPGTKTLAFAIAETDHITVGARVTSLGQSSPSNAGPFDLDEIAIYRTILNSNKIVQLYNQGRPADLTKLGGSAVDLQAWWRMGDDISITHESVHNINFTAYAYTTKPSSIKQIVDVLPYRTTNWLRDASIPSVAASPAADLSASVHKTNRNRLQRMEFANQGGSTPKTNRAGIAMTASTFDNYFVTHQIPRSDLQYKWINDSYVKSKTFGFATASDDIIFKAEGEDNAAVAGTYSNQVVREDVYAVLMDPIKNMHVQRHGQSFFQDLVLGLGEKDNPDSGSFGYAPPFYSEVIGHTREAADLHQYKNRILSHVSDADVFNSLMLARNGTTGYNSFKQLRTGDHPISKYLRRNNYYTFMQNSQNFNDDSPLDGSPKSLIDYNWPDKIRPISVGKAKRRTMFVREPAVSFSPHPVTVQFRQPNNPIKHTSFISYVNELDAFTNDSLNEELGILREPPQSYKTFLESFKNNSLEFEKISFRSNIYPKRISQGSVETQGRAVYDFSVPSSSSAARGVQKTFAFWRHGQQPYFWKALLPAGAFDYVVDTKTRGFLNRVSRFGHCASMYNTKYPNYPNNYFSINHGTVNQRDRTGDTIVVDVGGNYDFPSVAAAVGASIWPLDCGTSSADLWTEPRRQYQMGELVTDTRLLAGVQINNLSASVDPAYPDLAVYTLTHGPDTVVSQQYALSGATLHSQFRWDIPEMSGKEPWYHSYNDFVENVRPLAKDKSILPEFKISQRMGYYIDNGFTEEDTSYLSLNGAGALKSVRDNARSGETTTRLSTFFIHPISSSAKANGVRDEDFYITYTHSDFMRHFDQLRDDYRDIATPKKMALKCEVVKKMLPYQGFYPVLRAVQLGSEFSSSVGPFLSGTVIESDHAAWSNFRKSRHYLASAIQPLFSPGILYNTIKAGHAVDYPIYTKPPTFESGVPAEHKRGNNTIRNWSVLETGPDDRMPFEALVDLGKYSKQRTYMIRRKLSGSSGANSYRQNSHILSNTRKPHYELAMSNFLAEIPNFFLEDTGYSTYKSKKRSEWGAMTAGREYYMDVVINKTPDMIQYEGPTVKENTTSPEFLNDSTFSRGSAFGFMARNWAKDASLGSDPYFEDPMYAMYTPPEFYGKAYATIKYTASSLDELLPPSLETIFASSSITYNLDERVRGSVEADDRSPTAMHASSILIDHKMHITASVDLFERTREQQVEFDDQGRPAGIREPDSDRSDSDVWVINSKFECPIMNFSASAVRPGPGQDPVAINHRTRGMWAQYGEFAENGKGIFLSIQESSEYLNRANTPGITGSLAQICGFDMSPRQMGKIAAKKEISEAVVAIPFTEVKTGKNKGSKKFIKINKNILRRQLNNLNKTGFALPDKEQINTSITTMYEKMADYVFPPHLDFLNQPDVVDPFVMYIFEFKHELDRQELADIWQGVMPDIARIPETDEVSVIHDLDENEFFHGKPLPKDLRWMVFKVKKRAKNNFFGARRAAINKGSRVDNSIGLTDQEKEHTYSYNWPYDYFSLIEFGKIEAGVELSRKAEDDEE